MCPIHIIRAESIYITHLCGVIEFVAHSNSRDISIVWIFFTSKEIGPFNKCPNLATCFWYRVELTGGRQTPHEHSSQFVYQYNPFHIITVSISYLFTRVTHTPHSRVKIQTHHNADSSFIRRLSLSTGRYNKPECRNKQIKSNRSMPSHRTAAISPTGQERLVLVCSTLLNISVRNC